MKRNLNLGNKNPLKISVSDLGFVSNHKYANISLTAPVYRDKEIVKTDLSHDIYSLGICIYEIITQKKIFKEISNDEMIECIETGFSNNNVFKDILLLLN